MPKQKRNLWAEIADEYEAEHGTSENPLEDIVAWAIDTKRVEPSRQDVAKWARAQLRSALKNDEDGEGNRNYINMGSVQGELWGHRARCNWPMRQGFLHAQSRRVVESYDKVKRLHAVMNDERAKGEAEFQLHFDWDGEAEAV